MIEYKKKILANGLTVVVNREVAAYRAVTTDDIIDFSRRTFRPENCSTLIYKASK